LTEFVKKERDDRTLTLRNEATVTFAAQSNNSQTIHQFVVPQVAEKVEQIVEENNGDVQMMDVNGGEDKILHLPLPAHFNHLMKLFEQFEINFRLLRQRHDLWTTSLENMTTLIEGSFNRSFKESHFRQFLSLVPGLYLHKWEMIKGRLMLLIEIPEDV